MKAPSGNRRTTSRVNVQGHAYGANTPNGPELDGVLITWGDRLFYPGNRIVRVRQNAQGSQGSQHRAAAIRQRIEATVVLRAPQVVVNVTGRGRSMAAIAEHFSHNRKSGRLERTQVTNANGWSGVFFSFNLAAGVDRSTLFHEC
jgi:hypothetical protein